MATKNPSRVVLNGIEQIPLDLHDRASTMYARLIREGFAPREINYIRAGRMFRVEGRTTCNTCSFPIGEAA